jgi:hypothetical protein
MGSLNLSNAIESTLMLSKVVIIVYGPGIEASFPDRPRNTKHAVAFIQVSLKTPRSKRIIRKNKQRDFPLIFFEQS